MNSLIGNYLRAYATPRNSTEPFDWVRYLPKAEFALNSGISSTTGYSPFYAALGRTPCAPSEFLLPETPKSSDKVPQDSVATRVAAQERTSGLT